MTLSAYTTRNKRKAGKVAKSKTSSGGRKKAKPSTAAKARPRKKAAARAKPAKTTRAKPAEAKATKAKAAKKPAVKKTRLGRKELEEFRQMLLEKRRTLRSDLSELEEETTSRSGGNLSSMPTHMADMGTDNFEHEFTLGLLESEQALLREIDVALQRIEERTYGICLGTGEQIPKARLRAKPWAKYTVDFARKLELHQVPPPESSPEAESEDEGEG